MGVSRLSWCRLNVVVGLLCEAAREGQLRIIFQLATYSTANFQKPISGLKFQKSFPGQLFSLRGHSEHTKKTGYHPNRYEYEGTFLLKQGSKNYEKTLSFLDCHVEIYRFT